MADHYPYRIADEKGHLTLIWRPGEGDAPDEFVVDEVGELLAFPDVQTLWHFCDRNGWELIREGEATLDTAAVRLWVEHPARRPVSAGLLLNAWNFYEDLAGSVRAEPPLPSQGSIHDSAYEKIFGGHALDPDAGQDAWTDEETAAVRGFLRAGLDLWERTAARAWP